MKYVFVRTTSEERIPFCSYDASAAETMDDFTDYQMIAIKSMIYDKEAGEVSIYSFDFIDDELRIRCSPEDYKTIIETLLNYDSYKISNTYGYWKQIFFGSDEDDEDDEDYE